MQEHKPAMRVVREQQNDPRHPTSIFFLPHNQAFWTTPLQDHPPWKPEFREMSSWAVCGRKSYLFAGIGMEVMGDLTEISSGNGAINLSQLDGSEFSKLP
jgi:hypothetical protein